MPEQKPAEEGNEQKEAKRLRRDAAGDSPQAKAPDEGPWLAAAGVSAVCVVTTFLASFLTFGTSGFRDEADVLLLPVGLVFVFSVAAIITGVSHVKSGLFRGRLRVRPTHRRVALGGFIQAAIGGLIAGVAGYGLVFKYVNWVLTPG